MPEWVKVSDEPHREELTLLHGKAFVELHVSGRYLAGLASGNLSKYTFETADGAKAYMESKAKPVKPG